MSRELIIRPEAEAELGEAFEWYEARIQGLGTEFLLTIDATLAIILRNPIQHPLVHKTVRRALLRRFPYEIFFVLGDHHIVIYSRIQKGYDLDVSDLESANLFEIFQRIHHRKYGTPA